MLRIQQYLFCIMGILMIGADCKARDWRGIVPLHSTKTDVERLLGSPAESNDIRSIYHLENEDVYVVFSNNQHCSFDTTKIPTGTVLLVEVKPKTKLELTDLFLDQKRLREFKPSMQDPAWKGFVDDQEGMIVRSYKDQIDRIFYIGTANDRARCSSYYSKAEEFARLYIDFDTSAFDAFSDLTIIEERARLDNFAIYLQKDRPDWKAYVVSYPGSDADFEAQARAERAKAYLISVGLRQKRVFMLVGGVRSKATIELFAYPPDWPPPHPNPAAGNRGK